MSEGGTGAARRLILVPILHNAADLGSLAPEVRAVYERLAGPAAWEEHRRAVEGLWDAVEALLVARQLDLSVIRLYQDGLPLCGREAEIVRDVAARGSRNHQLLEDLVAGGALLVGTEDPALLLAEYDRIRQLLRDPPAETLARPSEASTLARDRYIAARIDATLEPGQTGILFIGLLHRVEEHLAPDIVPEWLLRHRSDREDRDSSNVDSRPPGG